MVVNVWDWRNNVKVASNKVSAKVKAVSFSCSGNYFVTVGNRHVKFWYLEYSRTTKYKLEPVPLMGRSAILGDQRNNYFCGVACGKGDSVESTYAITKSGLLCEFNSRRLLDKWVELRTTCANCISVGRDCIFVGCADGVVRCFDPVSLRFLATLPRPHHLGLDIAKSTHPSALSAHPPGAKYPHTTAVTFDEINRRVTCVYNDHSLFVWDVADLKRIGKSHSYLFHSACIWGVETYPLLPDDSEALLPSGTFLTCSSDDTIRIWNLDPHATFNTSTTCGKTTLYDMEVDGPQEYVLAACQDRNVRVYSVASGKNTRCFRGAQGEDGTLIKGSQLTFTRKHHVVGKTTLYDMEVDGPQEYVLAACQDRNVRVYSVASGKNTRCFRGAQGEDGTLIKVVLDSTGTYLATSCTDKSLYVYEYGSGECVASMFGHSELVTGLKFTEDGRHLISVSGDGKSAIAVTKPLPAADKEEVESALPPPLASRVDAKEDHGERSPEYKFSMGPLPMWAKRQMMEMNNNGPPNSSAANQNGQPPVPQPRGRWAQRIDAARSIFEGGDRASSFTASVNGKGDSPTKRPSGRVTQRGTGDRNRCPTDSSSAASSTRMEDGDAEDEHSDTEGSEMVFYPHSEEGSEGGDSAFQVRATTEVDLKEARRRLHRVRPDRPDRPARDPPSLYSSVTDFASELNSDEEDSSTAAEGEPGVPRPLGGSMCVSTDNLDKLGQREKFMKSNYESLDHSGMESGLDSTLTPVAALRSSISAKYLHSRGGTPAAGLSSPACRDRFVHVFDVEREYQFQQTLDDHSSSITAVRFVQGPGSQLQMISCGADKSIIFRKAQLQLGWRSNLSTSKSIGDLHSLKDGDSFERSFSELKSRDDSIRRTSSMTDISFSSRRRLLPTFPNSPGGSGTGTEPSAGLWAQAKPQAPPAPSSPLHHSPAPVTSTPARLSVPLRPSSSSNMSRSASMGSLHFPDQYSPGSGPPAPSPLARAPSAQLLTGRGSSALAKVRSTSALGRYPPGGQLPLLAQNSDDSSSSDVDQVEPSRARVSLSRSFASKDRSPGESSFLRSRNTPHEGPRAMVEPMVLHNGGRGAPQQDSDGSRGFSGGAPQQQALPGNPLHVPLTRDLCDRVADELAKVTRYAIQIFQRVTMDMELSPADKSAMTNTLAQGVVQAQQNLRPAAPPMPAWGGSGPASVPPPLPTAPPPSLGDVGSPGAAVPAVFQRYPAAGRFVNNGAAAAALQVPSPADVFQQQMHPLGRKGDQMSQSSSDLNALLQQYSEQLMKMVKEQINQAKTTDKSDGQ
ncbi:WD-repeat protein, putative [Ixodes scapularis]|uniref:WD-repeat protein, putative n=1 Tax=Ixodes scapularis TaxID=6945 RepID=B7PYL0_IXOSC|nr:WD-repeat protein, putative [Ixodes scapularis]|eukprot:XP_002403313.1 WD-repeat protein, putative [Ixodes scapularis]